MKCPDGGCEESKVIDSRPTENKVRRRRECIQCGFRFTTYEIIEDIPLMVIKKDNSIEPFDRQKLVDRLCRAAVKRPVKLETIENMVDEIAAELKKFPSQGGHKREDRRDGSSQAQGYRRRGVYQIRFRV